jgi:hypothetical protein
MGRRKHKEKEKGIARRDKGKETGIREGEKISLHSIYEKAASEHG